MKAVPIINSPKMKGAELFRVSDRWNLRHPIEQEDIMAGEDDADRARKRAAEMVSEGREAGSEIASNLKSVGIDTDRMTEAAGERVSELQRLVIEEVRAQPMRALAWAAAIGVVVGFWAAR